MRITALLLSGVLLTSALHARSDIYQLVSADGSITLTNLHRHDRSYVRVARENLPAVTKSGVNPPARDGSSKPPGLDMIVAQAAFDYELPAALLHAVIKAESNYNHQAVSPQGAAGLMQLMPGTAREMGVLNVFDPVANVRGGARYLKRMMRLFDNDLSLALAAYNAGPGTVLAYDRTIPPYPETQRYVPDVLGYYKRLQTDAKRPR